MSGAAKPQPGIGRQQGYDVQQEPEKPGLHIVLFIGTYWLAWLATIISDTLISVRKQFWPGELFIKSPIIRYIFTEHIYRWPMGGYYTLDPFFNKWGTTIQLTFFISSTVCTMLQLVSVGQLHRFNTYVSDTLVTLWLVICVLGGSWIGLTRHEHDIIALPFAWLSARTVQLMCLRIGIESPEVSESMGCAAVIISRVVFYAAYTRVLGNKVSIIAGVLIIEAAFMVWRWLVVRPSHERDAERGD